MRERCVEFMHSKNGVMGLVCCNNGCCVFFAWSSVLLRICSLNRQWPILRVDRLALIAVQKK